jgi:hypothetical protein
MIGVVCMQLKIGSMGLQNGEITIRAMSLHLQNLLKEQNCGSNITYQNV